MPAIAGMGTGRYSWILPATLGPLGRVPLRCCRSIILPIPASTWSVYRRALLAGLIMWRMSLDLVLTFALLGGVIAAEPWQLVVARFAGASSRSWPAPRANHLGLGQLRQPLAAAGQALAFGLILLSMALIALLRGELLDTWQNSCPKTTTLH